MKILDRYILTTFLQTFASVFVILFFIFILQTVWLFINELAGKDLDFVLIIKFLTFSMPGIVPMVLPLSILLASIMTFGDLSENYEFAAMKSSGVSLQRAMRSLILFILVLSACAFFFANNVIPYAQYRFLNFKANIAQVKPAMAIAEGQFNEVGNFNIKVDKKSGEKGNILTGVTIHKSTTNGNGNTTVIRARKGELRSSEDSNILQLILFDGYQFEDLLPKKYEDRKKMPFAKTGFKKYTMNMDLSQLNKVDVEEEKVSNTSVMLNLEELNYTLDSLDNNYNKELISYADNILVRTGINIPTPQLINRAGITLKKNPIKQDSLKKTAVAQTALTPNDNPLAPYGKVEKTLIIDIAKSNVNSTINTISAAQEEFRQKQKNINSHWLSVYDKFVMAYACLLMFFIGAPLGAIIQKGGLGLPIVFAILIFITFHFINTFGKKVAQEDGLTPFLGAWMSSIVLSPLAITLTYRATNDLQISVSFDWLTTPFKKIFGRSAMRPSFEASDRLVNLDTLSIIEDEEYRTLQKQSDAELADVVYNGLKKNHSEQRRNKAIKILDERGISQEALSKQDKLFNRNFEMLAEASESYNFNARVTLFVYVLTLVLALVARNNPSQTLLVVLAVASIAAFYISAHKTGQRLEESAKILKRKVGIAPWLATLLGIPFYPIFFFYNRKQLKSAVSQSNF